MINEKFLLASLLLSVPSIFLFTTVNFLSLLLSKDCFLSLDCMAALLAAQRLAYSTFLEG
jgi:hypothetical protein